MKILFFINGIGAGGKERRFTQLVKSIRLHTDIEFNLVTMSRVISYKEVLNLNIKIHYIIRNSRRDITVFKKFYRLCKNYKPDIVHCWDSMTAIYLIPVCKLLNIILINGMVSDSSGKQYFCNKYWWRARLTFPFSDMIVGNSYAGLRAYQAPVNRSICIYNGIDLSRFERLKDPLIVSLEIFGKSFDNFIIIGMVAAFEERKDYDTLVKAATYLVSQNQDIRFILVGDGSDFYRIKKSLSADLLKKIILLGRRSNVESIINIFDIGILLTNAKVHAEGISNSIIEYMALGKPVIATSGGGTNEIIINNNNGFLIDPGNVNQLIEKINILIENKVLINEFGKNGKQMVMKKFNLGIITKQYISLYNKLLQVES